MDTIDIPVSKDDGGPHGYETIESFNVASVCCGRGYRHGHLSTRRRTFVSELWMMSGALHRRAVRHEGEEFGTMSAAL
jgi:hypothetical protein